MALERTEQLSPREREVLTLAGEGLRSKEIARQLGISPRTVDVHIAHAVTALGARNRLDAALLLREDYVNLRKQPPAIAEPPLDREPLRTERGGISGWHRRLPILRNGRASNDLTLYQRLAWILVGALAIIVLFAQLAAGLRVAQEIALGLAN